MNYALYHKIPYYIGTNFEVLSVYIIQSDQNVSVHLLSVL